MSKIPRDHLLAVEHRKQVTDQLVAKLDTIVEQQADELMATQPLVTSEAGQANLLKQMGINTTSEILTHLDQEFMIVRRDDYNGKDNELIGRILDHDIENGTRQKDWAFSANRLELIDLSGELYNSFFRDINS